MVPQTKLKEPVVLKKNKAKWLSEYIATPSEYRKVKYRHPDVKSKVREETKDKCIYCESIVGHNTPGDVEHIAPIKTSPNLHFEWKNLTLACTECNRRKNAYFDKIKPFLNPYKDDVSTKVIHNGPIACAKIGDVAAEISIKTLELDSAARWVLIKRKIEKIDQINNLANRVATEADVNLQVILRAQLLSKADPSQEYSAMVKSLLAQMGLA